MGTLIRVVKLLRHRSLSKIVQNVIFPKMYHSLERISSQLLMNPSPVYYELET